MPLETVAPESTRGCHARRARAWLSSFLICAEEASRVENDRARKAKIVRRPRPVQSRIERQPRRTGTEPQDRTRCVNSVGCGKRWDAGKWPDECQDSREMHDAEVCTSPSKARSAWSKDHAEEGTTHREPARSGDAQDGEEGAKVYTARCAAAGTLSTTAVFCSASASFTRLVLGRFGRLGVSLDL